ncbi:far upstream element-binding protein 1-like isoform X2 [Gordionus sp. m RMFG-2023]|uniref:far upstream element-binding protein 1-like isoform X2 n=1 Tax=Gordionus sp. m RMFG-2023 TaxID=3053472 RepID=UPI0031FCF35A
MSQNDSNQAFADALQRARKIAAKMGEDKGVKRAADDDNSNTPENKRTAAVNDPFGAQLAALQQQKANQGKALVSEEYQVPDKMVGLVIGKGGENIVKIQRETGVLSVQFAQDSAGLPDRKCTITGPPSSIDKAKEMIDQMIEKAKATMIPPPNITVMNGEEETIVSVGIPSDKVGLVIGKSGDNIKKLQEEAGVRMVMIQDGIYTNAPEKELRIMGDPERVEKAKELVAELLAQHGYTFDANDYGTTMNGPYLTKEQIIPKCAIGLIIGKNGETIKRIMLDSGARIRFKEGDINPQGDRILIVAGGQNQIDAAFAAVNSYVQTAQVNYNSSAYGSRGGMVGGMTTGSTASSAYAQQQEMHVMVPTNKCGLVIGKGGENIKNISNLTGAHVELDRRVNTDPSSPEKAFVIRGTHSQISHAAQLVCEKADIAVPAIPAPQNSMNGAAAAMAAYGYPGMAALQAGTTANPYAPQGWGASTNPYNQWQGMSTGSADPSKQSQGGAAGGQDANLAAAWAAYYQQYYAQAAAAAGGGGAGGAQATPSPASYYQQGGGPVGSTLQGQGSQSAGGAGQGQGQGAAAYYAAQGGAGQNPYQQAASAQGASGAGGQDFTAAWQTYYQQLGMQQQLNKA